MSRLPQIPVPAMRAAVRLAVRPVLGPRLPVRAQRAWLAAVTRPTPLAVGVEVRPGTLAGRPVETAVPAARTGGTVLYLHGGGFCIGSPATHRALATHLAAATGATVHVLDYRLAPEHPFPAALDDAVAAWRELAAEGPATLDVRPEVQRRYNDWVQERIHATVWDRGCTSWYRTASGKNTTNWPDFTFAYRARTRRFDPSVYVLAPTGGER